MTLVASLPLYYFNFARHLDVFQGGVPLPTVGPFTPALFAPYLIMV